MKSVFGLEQNHAAVLCYAFGWISGIVVLVLERNNKFVRFHALQSTLWFLMLMVVGWVLNFLGGIPLIGVMAIPLISLLGLLGLISWIILMVKAYSGATTKIPIIGDVVWTQVNK